MHLAYPLPLWLAMLLAAAVAAAAFLEYRRPLAPLTRLQRGVLAGLRVAALAALVLFLFRPIAILPPSGSRNAVVPVLVDVSRSMRVADSDGQARLTRAVALLKADLLPALSPRFVTELYAVGDGLAPAQFAHLDRLAADARRTDLAGALAAVRERYRGQRVAGIVVLSDGGDTGAGAAGRAGAAGMEGGPPVFAVGIGSPDGPHDREVLGVVAGDPRLDQSSVDLHVSAVSTGFGRTPFTLRVLGNGQLLDARRVVPPADGSPIDEMFTVSPDHSAATVYTAEIPPDEGEPVVENNARSVLVSPSGRKRRLLVVEGAPGFEHSFMTRAWAADSGLEIDSVDRMADVGHPGRRAVDGDVEAADARNCVEDLAGQWIQPVEAGTDVEGPQVSPLELHCRHFSDADSRVQIGRPIDPADAGVPHLDPDGSVVDRQRPGIDAHVDRRDSGRQGRRCRRGRGVGPGSAG